MVLTASSFGARGLVIGASALVHVAVFAVAGTGRSASHDDALSLVEVTTIPVTDAVIEPKVDIAESAPAQPHLLHTHTHDYPVSPDHDATPHDESIVHTPYAPQSHSESDSPADAPSNVETAPAQSPLPSFTISIGHSAAAAGVVQTNATGNGTAADHDHDDAPVAENGVSERAHLVSRVFPVYPADARSEEVEADVPLEIVVDKSGAVVSARALSHVGYGFDEAAVSAIRQYRFSPAGRGGHAVAVRMPWTMQFRLK